MLLRTQSFGIVFRSFNKRERKQHFTILKIILDIMHLSSDFKKFVGFCCFSMIFRGGGGGFDSEFFGEVFLKFVEFFCFFRRICKR